MKTLAWDHTHSTTYLKCVGQNGGKDQGPDQVEALLGSGSSTSDHGSGAHGASRQHGPREQREDLFQERPTCYIHLVSENGSIGKHVCEASSIIHNFYWRSLFSQGGLVAVIL